MMSRTGCGALAALFTVFVWGLTFISTKVLLNAFTPLQILEMRFFMGWLALWLLCPRMARFGTLSDQLLFAFAGLSGVTLYFLLENVALTHTFASNVSVIASTAPFFTAILAWFVLGGKPPQWNFYSGFVLAMAGIALISFQDGKFAINPLGDGLALLAAVAWAFYSVTVIILARRGYGNIQSTRRIFFYGLLFMIPLSLWEGKTPDWGALAWPVNFGNLLFLGLCASALCFVTWTFSLKTLGGARASVFIYLVPVITIGCAAIFLHEATGISTLSGALLTIGGVALSEWQPGGSN